MVKLQELFSPFVRQYIVVVFVNLSVLGLGLGLAWSSPVLVKLSNQTNPVFEQPVTQEQGSWIVSVSFLSGFVANCLTVALVDRIGRKYCLLLSAVPRILSCVFLVFADAVWMLLVGRILVGLSDGCCFTVVPMYASEIASKEIRGGLGTIFQIFSSLGIVMMLSMGPFLDYYTLNIIMLSIVIATSIPLVFLPDSPCFLHGKGRKEEATKVLQYLRGSAEAANEEIKEYDLASNTEKMSFIEIVKSKTVLKSIGIIMFLGIGTQLTGFNAVAFYLQTILESTKTSVSPETASVVIGLIQLTASVFTAFIIDKFGRKPILAVSLVGVAVGMIGVGSFFYMVKGAAEVVGFLNYLPLISLVLVVYGFSAGLGSLLWPLMSELFDNGARAVGMFCGLVISVLFVFLTTKFFAPVTTLIGPAAVYWIFGVNSIILCVFILFCVPETKGKSFLEIQEALEGRRRRDDNKC